MSHNPRQSSKPVEMAEVSCHLASLYDRHGFHDEMLSLVSMPPLSLTQRSQLAIAHKSRVELHRHALQSLTELYLNSDPSRHPLLHRMATTLSERIKQASIDAVHAAVNGLIHSSQVPEEEEPRLEDIVFFQKMIADFCRYIAELEDNELLTANSSNQPSSSFKIKPIAHRSTSDIVLNTSSFAFPTLSSADLAAACLAQPTHAAHSAYNAALIRSQSLSPINIVRLGLALNASIFFHDTMKSPDNACKLAKSAFDAANAELGQRDLDIEAFEQVSLLPVLSAGSNPQQNDSVLLEECRIIMRKLRSNLVAWTLEDIEDS